MVAGSSVAGDLIVPCGEGASEYLVSREREARPGDKGGRKGRSKCAGSRGAEAAVAKSRRFGPVERWGETGSGSFVDEQQQYQW